MPQSIQQRKQDLQRFEVLLNTRDGVSLIEELEETWDSYNLIGKESQQTAYNCGLRDAYKFLKMLQKGELLDDG